MKIKARYSRTLVATALAAALTFSGCGSDADGGSAGAGGSSFFLNGGGAAGLGGAIPGDALGGPVGPVSPGSGSPVVVVGPGGDVAGFNATGLAALQQGDFDDIVAARNAFRDAVGAIGLNTTQAEKDTANFFYALTRVAALAGELQSDGQADGLNDVGDILDSLGFPTTPRTNYDVLVVPGTFAGSLTGEDARQFLLGRVREELEGAISNLSQVSQGFNVTWTRKVDAPATSGFLASGDATVESDFGDVLTFRSAFRMALGSILVAASYDLGGDIPSQLNNANNTTQSILAGNGPAGATHRDTSLLPIAQAAYQAGLQDSIDAHDFVQAETDPQNDDLINITSVPGATVAEYLADANTALSALTSSTTVRSSGGASTATLSLQNFFDADGFNLRAAAPSFVGDTPSSLFPGAPFGDVYGGYTAGSLSDPNRDINMNNQPDVLERPGDPGAVTFNFILAQASITIPSAAEFVDATFFSGPNQTGQVLRNLRAPAATTVTFDDVPMAARSFRLVVRDGSVFPTVTNFGPPLAEVTANVTVLPNVTQTFDGSTATTNPISANAVNASPNPFGLSVADQTVLFIFGDFSNGEVMPIVSEDVTFSIAPAGIASVSASGVVTGLAPGAATITVTYQAVSVNVPVTVVP